MQEHREQSPGPPTGRPAGHRMSARAAELIAQRVPFVHATVVRAEAPTSARPGDDALVLSDGSIEGFVGGQCAQESVRTAALAALADREPVLLRVLPDDGEQFPDSPGAQLAVNPCLSGGALEIFLEPQLPQPLVEIVGDTPIAHAVESVAQVLGFAVGRGMPSRPPGDAVAVIVMTHGTDEPQSIRAALDARVGYIGLVASHTRGEAVLTAMDLTPDERARVQTPAGISIGARTAEEIGLSIMAAVVKAVRVDGVTAPAGRVRAPEQAIDPVCGMTVVITPTTPHLSVDGREHWFCGPGCRDRYAEQASGQSAGQA
jgi:xanthine dehydrogenase accessory factor